MLNLNFTPFPELTTDRLVLRQLKQEDDKEIFTLRSNEEVNKYLSRKKAESIDEAREFINKIITGVLNNESLFWAITLKSSLKLIGTILFWNIIKEEDKAEIGYELLPEFQGKGIMQEAVKKVIEFGFGKLKLRTIEAYTSPENLNSIKLLEKFNFQLKENPDEMLEGEVVYILSAKI